VNADTILQYKSYFGSSKPFALCITGETFYITSDPKDASGVFKNTKTLTSDGFIEDILINEWEAPREFIERSKLPVEGGEVFYKNTVLLNNHHDWHREFLTPGPKFDSLSFTSW
jgi:hypothetical protein